MTNAMKCNNNNFVHLSFTPIKIHRLLERPRQCVNVDSSPFEWDPSFSDSADYIKSRTCSLYGDRALFAMHNTLKTQSRFDTDHKMMRIHCQELYDLSEL